MGFDAISGQGQTGMSMGGQNIWGGASGQSSMPGYGIQPPRISSPYNVGSLNLGARQQNPYETSANVYTPGADTSAMHEANVAMAQAGWGNMGLQGYRGYPGETPGTSNSNYGFGPQAWADINAYLSNPTGDWQLPTGATMGQYGGVQAGSNANRYQMMEDTIRASMTGQWPQAALNTASQYGALQPPQSPNPAFNNWLPEQITNFATNMPLQYASGYNMMPPQVLQNMGIPVANLPGSRTY